MPKIKDLHWSWSEKDNLQEWEVECENSYLRFLHHQPNFKNIPFSGMIFKMIWVECIKNYSK